MQMLKIVNEKKRLPKTLEGFEVGDRYIFRQCFADAGGSDYLLDARICYLNLPPSIKGDILTLSLRDEAVQAKITNWIKEEYLTK